MATPPCTTAIWYSDYPYPDGVSTMALQNKLHTYDPLSVTEDVNTNPAKFGSSIDRVFALGNSWHYLADITASDLGFGLLLTQLVEQSWDIPFFL